MPDKSINTKDKNRLKSAGEELNSLVELIGRKPNDLELKLFVHYLQSNLLKKNIREHKDLCELTNELNCVFKSKSVVLNSESEYETESSKVIIQLINSILKNKAQPIAIVNSFTLGEGESENAKVVLNKIIKGTGKVSNITGIPNLNTSLKFNSLESNHQHIHCCAIGIGNNKSSKKVSAKNKIFLLGKLINNNAQVKNKQISTYHFKFLKDTLLELFATDSITSIEVIGKNGIVGSILRISYKFSIGQDLDVSPLQEMAKSADFECLFNEQPTALLIITENEKKLIEASNKWELDCLPLGKLTSNKNLTIKSKTKKIIDLPIIKLIEQFSNSEESSNLNGKVNYCTKLNIKEVKQPKKLRDVAWFLINHPNIASKSCIQQQYDTMVGGASMNISFPSDAEIINLKGTNKALAISILEKTISLEEFNEPEVQIAISELSRNMVCSGAKPLSLYTNIIQPIGVDDFDWHKEINYTINEISEKLKIEATLDNKFSTNLKDLHAHFSMIGLIEDKNHQMTMSFKDKGNIIFLIGSSGENLAGSEYLQSYHNDKTTYLSDFEMNTERKINMVLLELIAKNLICSAHNVAKGGLFLSLVESAMVFGFGFDIITDTDIRTDAFLFGEKPGRVIVSVTPNKEDKFIDFMMQKELPFLAIGHVTKGEMRVDDISYGFIDDAREEYNSALKKFLDKIP